MCRAMCAARNGPAAPLLSSSPRRLPPSTNSITRKNTPSSVLPKSCAATTFGCSRFAAATASRSKRATTSGNARHLRVQELHRDALAQRDVLAAIDRAHAAFAHASRAGDSDRPPSRFTSVSTLAFGRVQGRPPRVWPGDRSGARPIVAHRTRRETPDSGHAPDASRENPIGPDHRA